METKHTPGPWIVNKKVKTSVEQSEAGQGINLICQCEDPDGIRTKDNNEANARLIAAAPEMLDALEGITDILHNHYGDDPDETPFIDRVFAAIKKAKGE